MAPRRDRYLAYIDYLGTRELYRHSHANADKIEDRRLELEHAIQIRLQRQLAGREVEVGVFSDTVMVAGQEIATVLACSASLLNYVLRKNLTRWELSDIRLLRGGVSRGPEIRSGYLRPSAGVSVIPFFDGSLAFAYEVESLRRGSRIYISPEIDKEQLDGLAKYIFLWSNITGAGVPAADAREFLWPAFAYATDPCELARIILESMRFWREALKTAPLDGNHYRTTLYHFDETLKVMIRSVLAFEHGDGMSSLADSLFDLLPSEEDTMEDCSIRYLWGVWFQVLFVLETLGFLSIDNKHVAFTVKELRRRAYWDKFIAEAEYEDYAILRPLIARANKEK